VILANACGLVMAKKQRISARSTLWFFTNESPTVFDAWSLMPRFMSSLHLSQKLPRSASPLAIAPSMARRRFVPETPGSGTVTAG
jgi:hypothetical protein